MRKIKGVDSGARLREYNIAGRVSGRNLSLDVIGTRSRCSSGAQGSMRRNRGEPPMTWIRWVPRHIRL